MYMGNGYYDHHHPHRTTFLPMLCSRPSIKDVSVPKWLDRRRSSSFSDDPLSPKISCIGEVKRNNKIVGFPATSYHRSFAISSTPGSNSRHSYHYNINAKYFQLRKLFSGKNLGNHSATATANNVKTCGKREGINRTHYKKGRSVPNSISVDNLDPPLPVIKRLPKRQGEKDERDTLWQRRSHGVALESLQIKEIQLTRNHLAPISNETATF